METADFRGKAGRPQTHARRCSAFPRGAGRIGCAAPRGAVSADAGPCCSAGSRRRGRHNLRCRGSHLSPFRRGSTGSVLLRHMMPWSLHFIFRGGPEKKRSKEKGPPARRKIPVARTPFRSACNSLSAHFRLERRCRISPQQYRLRDAARRPFSCRRFLRRHWDFSNGRCH